MNRLFNKIDRTLGITEPAKRNKVIKNPPRVDDKHIVFLSTEDYSGNPRALYEYMIEHGYNEKYRITWLFEFAENYRTFTEKNVVSVKMYDEEGNRTAAAQRALMSAKYAFFSHNVNWIKKQQEGQVLVDLWHGCGYKGRQPGEDRVIMFDYCLVTGPKYIDIQKDFFKQPAEKMLPIGYPRNEWLKTDTSGAAAYLNSIKKNCNADKAIIWMPTFRQNKISRLSGNHALPGVGLPLMADVTDMDKLNEVCRKEKVVLIVKQHAMQDDCKSASDYSNIVFIEDSHLKEAGVIAYEFLGKTDALLTDYSSVATDYLLTDKPIGFVLADFEEYEASRTWSFPNVKDYMPGHHIYDTEELYAYIRDVATGKDEYKEIRAKVRPEMVVDNSVNEKLLSFLNIEK